MSVYKPAKSRYYQFDFVIQGRRHHGSTGQTSRRAAEVYEARQRQAAAEGRLGEASQLTLDLAAGKWFAEHGRHRGDADQQLKRLQRLVTLFPKDIRLAEITTSIVSDAMQKRRSLTFTRAKPRIGKDGRTIPPKAYAVSNATVNRDVIQTLRPVLIRAATIWEAQGLPQVAWDKLALPVGRPQPRVYSQGELAAWTGENGPTAALALRLLRRYGLRFGELFFPLDAFEPEGPRLAWWKGRKFDVWHTVPLLPEDAQEIAARVGRARKADLKTIWYVERIEPGPNPGDPSTIALDELTYYGLQQRLRTSSKRANIRQGRVIHGARSHAGMAIQRAFKDKTVTQRLLGHLDSRSTDVYVKAMEDDVRAGLEAADLSRNSPEPKPRDRKKRKPA